MRATLAITSALLTAGILAGSVVAAEPEVLDRIVAVVGDEIILLSEVEEEVYLAQMRGDLDSADAAAIKAYRGQVLDAMIDGKILYAQARSEGIRLTREEVDQAVEGMIDELRQRFPSEQALEQQLEAEGTTLDGLRTDYRDRVEEQLMVRRLVDRYVRSGIMVDEREIRAYWDENQATIPKVPAVLELRRILVSLSAVAAVDSSAIERADIVHRRLENGENFETLATAFSEGPAASRGGDLGWFRPADLEPSLRDAVKDLKVGEYTEAIVTSRGAHILLLQETRGDEMHLRQIVFLRDNEAARSGARSRAEALLRRLRSGADFAEIARAESDDQTTRGEGGYIGKVPVESLAPNYRLALESLDPGGISDILEDDEGYSIFRVDSKEGEHAPTYEEVHDRIAAVLEQQKAQEMYKDYVDSVREGIYVDNRMTAES